MTTDPISQKWQDMPVTIIAAFNATLLHTAVSMLGMKADRDEKKDSVKEEMAACLPAIGNESISSSQETNSSPDANAVPIVSDDGSIPSPDVNNSNDDVKPIVKSENVAPSDEEPLQVAFPKIHINGQGENSGMGKWKSVLKQIQHV